MQNPPQLIKISANPGVSWNPPSAMSRSHGIPGRAQLHRPGAAGRGRRRGGAGAERHRAVGGDGGAVERAAGRRGDTNRSWAKRPLWDVWVRVGVSREEDDVFEV